MLGEGEARLGRARAGEEERRGEGEPLELEARASWELLALAISTTGRVGSSLTLVEQGLQAWVWACQVDLLSSSRN